MRVYLATYLVKKKLLVKPQFQNIIWKDIVKLDSKSCLTENTNG